MDHSFSSFQPALEWITTRGSNLIVAIALLFLGRLVARWLAIGIRKALIRSLVELALAHFLEKVVYYALFVALLIAAADKIGIQTASFLTILGAAGLATGLALKDSLANLAAGIMLIIFRPFKVGDVITAASMTGLVERIDIFNTLLLTGDNQVVIIPNSAITAGVITNINAKPTRRIDLLVVISYEDNLLQTKEILEEIVRSDQRILSDPAPAVGVSGLGESSVNLLVRPWVNTADYWEVRLALIEKIKMTFDEKGITIPFPQRDVHLYQEIKQSVASG